MSVVNQHSRQQNQWFTQEFEKNSAELSRCFNRMDDPKHTLQGLQNTLNSAKSTIDKSPIQNADIPLSMVPMHKPISGSETPEPLTAKVKERSFVSSRSKEKSSKSPQPHSS